MMLILSCDNDDANRNNQFLPDVPVNFSLNLNLPQYVSLKSPGGTFVETGSNRGIKGVVIYNLNNSTYFAYELSDPNHAPNECSALMINGIEGTCGCEDQNTYTLITGQPVEGTKGFPLRAYVARRQGNLLSVSSQ